MPSVVFLRAAPLLAATSALTFTVREDMFIRSIATYRPDLRPHANRVLPTHDKWLWGELSIVFSMYPISIATAAANPATRDGTVDIVGPEVKQHVAVAFYAVGLVFQHLAFSICNFEADNSAMIAA